MNKVYYTEADEIVAAVLKELKGKNAGMDIIKMCVRIALNMSGEEWLDDEHDEARKEIVKRICENTDFNPFNSVMKIVRE